MASRVVVVEEVSGRGARRRTSLRRFHDVPYLVHAAHPRWSPPPMAVERARLDPKAEPFFDHGDLAAFVARRDRRPVGRITAQVAGREEAGWFGFFDCDDDDPAAATALLGAARAWLAEAGCTTMTGPVCPGPGDEPGVRVAGHDQDGATGAQWHPPAYAGLLAGGGLEPAGDVPWWRLDARGGGPALAPAPHPGPAMAGRWSDRRLLLAGPPGSIRAVPDLTPAMRGKGVRTAWQLAATARTASWEGVVVTAVEGEPSVLVPALQRAAFAAGYRWVLAPWSPDDRPPDLVYRLFTTDL